MSPESLSQLIDSLPSHQDKSMFDLRHVTFNEVLNQLTTIRADCSTGPDQIPAKYLKLGAEIIASPLTHILNSFIENRSFPEAWKVARVSPVPKVDSPFESDDYRPIAILPAFSKVYEKLVLSHGTRGNNILDLIFTNMADFYQSPVILAPLSTSDHNVVLWKPKDSRYNTKGKVFKVKQRDMRWTNMNALESALAKFDWRLILCEGTIDQKVEGFTKTLNSMIDEYLPESSIRRHSKDKPFITNKVKSLIIKRNKAHNSGNVESFKLLRAQVAKEIRIAKSTFYDQKVRPKRTACSKSWWKHIKCLTGKKKAGVTLVDPETKLELNGKQSATLINDFFADLTKDYPMINDQWLNLECSDSLPNVDVHDVQERLLKINANKAPGPNDPVLKVLKEYAYLLAAPLTEIFNESFRRNYFPKLWKQYKLIGIPKSIPCVSVENLRPIALTSVLSKIQESFVVNWMNADIQDKISEAQFGGIRRSSTTLALLFLLHKWYEAMDTPNRVIRIIFLDFKKAFDLIDHNILLKNMKSMGVRETLVKWFATYLDKRSHFTEFDGDISDLRVVRGGVPQGSKIGPTAFIIKINNLPAVLREEVNRVMATSAEACAIIDQDTVMFMDDSTLYEVLDVTGHISGMPIGSSLEKTTRVVKFTEDEHMALNLKKCEEMVIDFRKNKTVIPPLELNGHVLKRVTSFKLLGLWIDDDLKWKSNVNYIVKKAAKRLFFLKTLKSYYAPVEDLKLFYTSVVRSTLEYCAYVWHGNLTSEQSRDIERIQKRALRIIFPGVSYEEALVECNLNTLESRREDICINLIKSLRNPDHKLHGLLPPKICEIRTKETRLSGEKFYNFNCRTQRFKNSPIVYGIEKYNNLVNI